ncbi:MAG: glycosyltransferase [Sphingomonas sp.]|jgi:UDP:flavonoid glycosyltransferase YjiC (YdhE family)
MDWRIFQLKRKIILPTIGTLGDLYPFIALGLALRSRGFEPILAVSQSHIERTRAAGLEAHAIVPSFEEVAARLGIGALEEAGKRMEDQHFIIREVVMRVLEHSTQALDAVAEDTAAIVGSIFALAGPIVAEKRAIPFVPAILQPMALFSAVDPPMRQGMFTVASAHNGALARRWNRMIFAIVRFEMRRRYAGEINRVRGLHGLPKLRATPVLEPESDRLLRLGLYSPHFAPLCCDHPANVRLTGFPGFDAAGSAEAPQDAALARFLASGPAPLVFTLGSFAVYTPGDFYRESVAVARALGRRAVLLTGTDKMESSDDIFVRNYTPHSQIFPHAAAIIHHGGIGTTGQALRAGKPQLVVPHMGDQRDNGARIVRLGLGGALDAAHYTAARATRALAAVLGDEHHLLAAREFAAKMADETGAEAAADAVVEMLEKVSSGRALTPPVA